MCPKGACWGVGGVAYTSTCLACVKPWVLSSALCKQAGVQGRRIKISRLCLFETSLRSMSPERGQQQLWRVGFLWSTSM